MRYQQIVTWLLEQIKNMHSTFMHDHNVSSEILSSYFNVEC